MYCINISAVSLMDIAEEAFEIFDVDLTIPTPDPGVVKEVTNAVIQKVELSPELIEQGKSLATQELKWEWTALLIETMFANGAQAGACVDASSLPLPETFKDEEVQFSEVALYPAGWVVNAAEDEIDFAEVNEEGQRVAVYAPLPEDGDSLVVLYEGEVLTVNNTRNAHVYNETGETVFTFTTYSVTLESAGETDSEEYVSSGTLVELSPSENSDQDVDFKIDTAGVLIYGDSEPAPAPSNLALPVYAIILIAFCGLVAVLVLVYFLCASGKKRKREKEEEEEEEKEDSSRGSAVTTEMANVVPPREAWGEADEENPPTMPPYVN
uniref:Uncharacterized protein n=1 Tax=Chromera velia CCMP2878 TaxID=1169474 RepID=A0A0G4I3X2_9ALVE|eukprot:Cvel_10789.t1-p1 / transcript=Cvel_10789.t1 / gene=Cvel_10789 / organism=Chromera_velia_CCMP2878 / gene_product=hypothetical protein / transcript_product=hypothetical protein / location=Cvel_scaffold659:60285-61256(-) / protein_length=324 / sequence_SO=supercontig / SO=protein_coding / is_pseudo=false